jgi:hypothetical protein
MASVRCSGGTTAAICGKFAALNITPAVPMIRATTMSQVTFRLPRSQASGTDAAAAAATSSQAIINGRWRSSRSAIAPECRPNSRAGTKDAAVRRPISKGEAVNRVTAVRGTASLDTSEPVIEMVRADQSRR